MQHESFDPPDIFHYMTPLLYTSFNVLCFFWSKTIVIIRQQTDGISSSSLSVLGQFLLSFIDLGLNVNEQIHTWSYNQQHSLVFLMPWLLPRKLWGGGGGLVRIEMGGFKLHQGVITMDSWDKSSLSVQVELNIKHLNCFQKNDTAHC